MPATEETYRNQRSLHLVFAVSSIAMLLAIVWMILADHNRPWKQVQRRFHEVEDAKLRAQEQAKKKEQDSKKVEELAAKIQAADEAARANRSAVREVDSRIKTLGGKVEGLDTDKRFMKAELDSQRSLYDGMIDRGEERQARVYVSTTIVETERKLHDLSVELEAAQKELDDAKAKREELLGRVDDLKKEKDKLTRDADRVARVIEQKEREYFGWSAFVRNLPGMDLVPPTKIQQISLPELTINYNFKEVPRYDRCTTCHLGIEDAKYLKDAPGNETLEAAFAAHPHVNDGAVSYDPKGKPIAAGLYLDANGPHPVNSFGCTICHGGQGSGTDFTFSSHEPNDPEQKEQWEKDRHWHKIHHWDEPMLPRRFMESSCLKCHHDVADVPQATKLQAGYERIVRYGCTGCHTIGGEGSFGPDLTDERQVGPNLAHIGSKVSKDWTLKWIKNPHAFRPDSRMPRFYGVTNNNSPKDWPKSHAEIHAITHYLFAKSKPPAGFVDPPKGDPAKGKDLFLAKGCLACHAHRPYDLAEVQPQDKDAVNPKYKPDKALTFDPSGFPASVQQYARADYGPNLSNIAAKFQSHEQGFKWLANWVRNPEAYHPKSLMPNLQLSAQDSSDIAAWILSVPGEWPVSVDVPPVTDPEVKTGIDQLVKLYVGKAGGRTVNNKFEPVPLAKVDEVVEKEMSLDEKLMYLGERTISRLGCFGCHNVSGYETAKPIGTALNGWGVKSPAKLDYAHIAEYLQDQNPDDHGGRDGTDHYYQEQLAEQTRSGFLFQKLHRPRSYDYKKTNEDLKTWDERLRMPQFAWANDPKAVEEVMTFVLGLTGEKIASRYLPKVRYKPRQHALAQGAKVLNRYNCAGCHVLKMPQYTVDAATPLSEAFTDLKSNLRASYTNRGTDYQEFASSLPFDEKKPLDADKIEASLELKPDPGKRHEPVVLEGMPIGVFDNELTVQLWKPVTIRGYTFGVGDTLTLDQTKVKKTEAEGGNFAWLFAATQAERTGNEFSTFWNRMPPPLVREGLKVQTPWLTGFLKDPYPIRPAVNLRMPRFHYGKADDSAGDETAGLANYFAAADNTAFPYQTIPQRTQEYVSAREAEHPGYLKAGWSMMTAQGSPCLSCHAIGQYQPTGGAQVVNGPDLRQVAPRFRPEFLQQWLAKPSRLVPYTAMPQNIAPHGTPQLPVPKGFEGKPYDQVTAIRDTLLNYVNAVEQQLAGPANAPASTPAAAPGPKADAARPAADVKASGASE